MAHPKPTRRDSGTAELAERIRVDTRQLRTAFALEQLAENYEDGLELVAAMLAERLEDGSLKDAPDLYAYLLGALRKMADGVPPGKALAPPRRGRKRERRTVERGLTACLRVLQLHHVDRMSLESARAQAGDELGLTEKRIEQLFAEHRQTQEPMFLRYIERGKSSQETK